MKEEGEKEETETAKGCHQKQQAAEWWNLQLEDVSVKVCQSDW